MYSGQAEATHTAFGIPIRADHMALLIASAVTLSVAVAAI